MGRHKDRTLELTDIVRNPESIMNIKRLIAYQRDHPTELGGDYFSLGDALYFQIYPSREEDVFISARRLSHGDDSGLQKMLSYLKAEDCFGFSAKLFLRERLSEPISGASWSGRYGRHASDRHRDVRTGPGGI